MGGTLSWLLFLDRSTTWSGVAYHWASSVASLTGAARAGGPHAAGGALITGGAALAAPAMTVPVGGIYVMDGGGSEGGGGSSDAESPR